MILGATVVAAGVALLLYAELAEHPSVRAVGKPIASAGFLLAALGAPALRLPTGTGWLLLAALALAALGDLLLLPTDSRWLLAGMAAFALAHVGYSAWFLTRGVRPLVLGISVATMLVLGHLAWTWLAPHVGGRMHAPVRIYVLLISLMTACALGVAVRALQTGSLALALPAAGGVLFCASDLAVARDRFIAEGTRDRLWGLPLYYIAQLLLASAVLAR